MEIVGVVPGSLGAAAGPKGREQRVQTLVTAGILVASTIFPPAIPAVAVLGSSEIGEFHEFLIAVDGVRIHDVIEFGEALNQAEPGEIVYLTIVVDSQRKQIQLVLPGRRRSSSSLVRSRIVSSSQSCSLTHRVI